MPYTVDPLLGCWISTAAPNSAGYPVVWHRGQMRPERRVVYERERGAIAEGHDLRSTCLVKRCVNPSHHEPIDALVRRRLPRRRRPRSP